MLFLKIKCKYMESTCLCADFTPLLGFDYIGMQAAVRAMADPDSCAPPKARLEGCDDFAW
jgi:hypothetical protein